MHRYAFETGNFRKAARLFAAARDICETPSGSGIQLKAGILLANILHFEAWMHTKLVRQAPASTPQQALKMTKRALDIRLSLLGPSDQSVAASYGNMALFAVATGEYEDSLRFSKSCLDIRIQDESGQTTNFSCIYLYYGWCYAKMGRPVDAESSLHKRIHVLIEKFGEEGARKKPHFAWILTALASLYLKIDREEDAYKADMQVFEINRSIYHSTSPRVFVSWYKAAWWSWRKGSLEEARKTAEDLNREMEDVDQYPGHRARTLNLLSNVFDASGLEEQGQGLRTKAVEMARSVEGHDADFDELVFFHDR